MSSGARGRRKTFNSTICKAELASVRGATRCLQGSVSSGKVLHSLHSIVGLYLAALFPLAFQALGHQNGVTCLSLGAKAHKSSSGRPKHGEAQLLYINAALYLLINDAVRSTTK